MVEPDARRRRAQLRRWNTHLDTDDGAIDRIARWTAARMTTPRAIYRSERLPTMWPHIAAEYMAQVHAAM